MQCSSLLDLIISMQDVIKLTCMAVTVTSFVPPTVNTTPVTFSREPVLGVSLDGRGYTVTQVKSVFNQNIYFNLESVHITSMMLFFMCSYILYQIAM